MRLWPVAAILAWALLIRVAPLADQVLKYGQVQSYHKGGLFWAFSEAIRAGGYQLPTSIFHYSAGGLPFAYPPLAFYLTALTEDFLHLGPATVLIVSATLSFLSVVAFSALMHRSTLPTAGKLASILAFATVTQGWGEHITGEGLAESLGTLCLVLLLADLPRLDQAASKLSLLRLGVSLGVCVLAAPGTAYAAPVTLVLYYLFSLISKERAVSARDLSLRVLAVGFAGLAVASPYLMHVQTSYGIDLLARAFGGQGVFSPMDILEAILLAFLPNLNDVPLWSFVAILGMWYCLRTRRYFWVAWPLFIAITPREGRWMMALPISLLAGMWLGLFFLPRVEKLRRSGVGLPLRVLVAAGAIYAALVVPAAELARGITEKNSYDTVAYVTEGEAIAMETLRDTIPSDTTVLMFGNENEWAPQLMDRTILNTWYGSEWVPRKMRAIFALNEAVTQSTTAEEFVDVVRSAHDEHPDYFPLPDLVYFSRHDAFRRGNPDVPPGLVDSLKAGGRAAVIADNADATILRITSWE